MFIDCSKFEKVLKADYKSWGVKFGLTKRMMYILHGTGWIIEANASYINKEFLGTTIKALGPAPKPGEFIKYQKGSSPQHEMELEPMLWDMAEVSDPAYISLIKIIQNDNVYSVTKTPKGARLINDKRLAMIAPCKCTEDEIPPCSPVVHDDWLLTYNDDMAIGICFTDPDYKPELEVLRLLSGVDFFWQESEALQIGLKHLR